MSEQKMREAFEAWLASLGVGPDDMDAGAVGWAWRAWKEAWRSAGERNQCDGCMSGAELDGNMHRSEDGKPFMVCQRHRYAVEQGREAVAFDVVLDEGEATLLRDSIGDEEAQSVRLQVGDGHSGHGLYVSAAEYPEEGSAFVTAIERAAPPKAKTEQEPAFYWDGDTEYPDFRTCWTEHHRIALYTAKQPVKVPDGWQLVPKKLTQKMYRAARWQEYAESSSSMHDVEFGFVECVYEDLLAAAPQPGEPSELT